MMKRMEGRTTLISGSIGGIGAATARRLSQEGGRVALADINLEAAEAVAESIRANGGDAIAIHLDLAEEESIARTVARALEHYGALDVLFNNAADTRAEVMAKDGPVDLMDADVWDRVFRINARGTMLMTKHALPALIASGHGSIINTSSGAALRGDFFRTAYAASKSAIHALTLYTAAQFGKQGVRCNVVSPGMVATEHAQQEQGGNFAMYLRHHLTPVLGRPEDLAAVVAMLASDDGRFVTGQIIGVDGGVLSHMPHFADSQGLADEYRRNIGA
jgi:NAD(P)-dependent dehydrogenase (short-subunit alcohol dehydrogenase family)